MGRHQPDRLVLGGSSFYREMVERSGYAALVELLTWYGAIVGTLGDGLVLWAVYRWARFRSKERRSALPAVTTKGTADYFGVSETHLAEWRASKRALVHGNERGEIVRVEVDAKIARPSLRLLGTDGVQTAIGQDAAPRRQDADASVRRQHRARVPADQRRR